MFRIPDLRYLSATLLRVLRYLDINFERLMRSLEALCPEASDVWLAERIVTSAFDGAFI